MRQKRQDNALGQRVLAPTTAGSFGDDIHAQDNGRTPKCVPGQTRLSTAGRSEGAVRPTRRAKSRAFRSVSSPATWAAFSGSGAKSARFRRQDLLVRSDTFPDPRLCAHEPGDRPEDDRLRGSPISCCRKRPGGVAWPFVPVHLCAVEIESACCCARRAMCCPDNADQHPEDLVGVSHPLTNVENDKSPEV